MHQTDRRDCDNYVKLDRIYINTDIGKVCRERGKFIMWENKVVNRIGKIMVAAVVSSICLSGCASSGGAEYRQVDMNEAVEIMENENVLVRYQLRANYQARRGEKTGFWDIILVHQKPIPQVPKDMRP